MLYSLPKAFRKFDVCAKTLGSSSVRLLQHEHDMHLANANSQKAFLSSYALIPPSRLSLLTDGIDCRRFKPGDKTIARQQIGLAADTFWIICVAQTRPEKRLDYVIRAAKRV